MGNELSNPAKTSVASSASDASSPVPQKVPTSHSFVVLPDKSKDDSVRFEYGVPVKGRHIGFDNPFGWNIVTKILEKHQYRDKVEWYPARYHENPFYASVLLAFSKHYKYVISPDVLWTQVLQGVALHVWLYQEQFDGKFFTSKKEFVVEQSDCQLDDPVKFKTFMDGIMSQVFEHSVARAVVETLRKPYSTTSPAGQLVFDLGMMDILKNHAVYVNSTLCGIPGYTVLGSVEDWVDFTDRLILIGKELHMSWWTDLLIPCVDAIMGTVRTLNDGKSLDDTQIQFWNSFVQYESHSGTQLLTGWINLFNPYPCTSVRPDKVKKIYEQNGVPYSERSLCSEKKSWNSAVLFRIDLYTNKLGENLQKTANGVIYFSIDMFLLVATKGSGCVPYVERDGSGKRTNHTITYGTIGFAVNLEEDTVMPILGYIVDSRD